jgi:putative phosphoribosyl transferase
MKRFPTLAAAGRELAGSLTKFTSANNTVVVAIANGGVPVAAEISRELKLPLELLFIQRLWAPPGPQTVLCAVNVAGTLLLDEGIPSPSANAVTGLDHAVADRLQQLNDRVRSARGDQQPVELKKKTVVLVDNGIHTGSTMLIAIRAVHRLHVARVVVAVPVTDPVSRDAVSKEVDEIICLASPEKFGHVGMWYAELVRPSEDEIMRLYKRRQ